jgi:hypothetical protein
MRWRTQRNSWLSGHFLFSNLARKLVDQCRNQAVFRVTYLAKLAGVKQTNAIKSRSGLPEKARQLMVEHLNGVRIKLLGD